MIARKMLCVTVFKCVLLLLWQLIFSNVTRAQVVIECQIRDDNDIIHLKWKKSSNLLANKHLPIWIMTKSEGRDSKGHPLIQIELKKHFLSEHIGDFTLYHNEEKTSAIVYYHNRKLIYGIIDTRYTIRMLPLSVCEMGEVIAVGGRYVKAYGEWDTFHNSRIPSDLLLPREKEVSSSFSTSNQNKLPEKTSPIPSTSNEPKPIVLCPEILLIIPYEVVKTMKYDSSEDYITHLVEYYILYFNAVDMLYSKLSTENLKIYINLAGIVIESQEGLWDLKTCQHCVQGGKRDTYIDVKSSFRVISGRLKRNRRIFPEDSYDFVFIPSRYPLYAEKYKDYEKIFGLSETYNPYNERKKNYGRSSMLMVQHGTVNEYIVAAHEIAHLMTIEHDSDKCGKYYNGRQCYAIMQGAGRYCPKCLHWSEKSIENLKKIVSTDKEFCFLLNFPRSLFPYGTPFRTIKPSIQCLCYGYESLDPLGHPSMVPEAGCNQILHCDKNGDRVETILPIDGTPCGNDKVCWNRHCVPVTPTTTSSPSTKPGPSGIHCHRTQ